MKKLYVQIIAPSHKTSENVIFAVSTPLFWSAHEPFRFLPIFFNKNSNQISYLRNRRSYEDDIPLILTGMSIFLLQFEILNTTDFNIIPKTANFSWKQAKMAETDIKSRILLMENHNTLFNPSF